jgi:serine/threonine protein kinase
MILEYHSEGTLADEIIKKDLFSETESRIIMAQLLLTVDFLHLKGIVHRDLKLQNILMCKT